MSLSTPRSSPPPSSGLNSTAVLDSPTIGAGPSGVSGYQSDHLDSSTDEDKDSDVEVIDHDSDQPMPSQSDQERDELAAAPRRATRSAGKSSQRLGAKSSAVYGAKGGGSSGRKAAGGRSGAGLERGLSGVADERGTGLGDKLLDRDYQRILFDPFAELAAAKAGIAAPLPTAPPSAIDPPAGPSQSPGVGVTAAPAATN